MGRRMLMAGGGDYMKEARMPYIMFTSDKDTQVHFGNGDNTYSDYTRFKYDETFEYSYDAVSWTKWEGSGMSYHVGPSYGNLYIRGVGNSNVCGNYYKYNFIFSESDARVSCYGNIMSLLDYKLAMASVPDNCFAFLFYNAVQLVKAPVLPATSLGRSCYMSMFAGCENLLQAPALPAATMAESCYSAMFKGCISLTKAPALPAMTLAYRCYYEMFYGCTSITEAPALPAMKLEYACYGWMFAFTGITAMPYLPAETLAEYCYERMFWGCGSLASASILPAKQLAKYCYRHMFYSCPALERAPVLPATSLAIHCYDKMFINCGRLNYVKAMFIDLSYDNDSGEDLDNYSSPADQYMYEWLDNIGSSVQYSGTFVKNSKATWNKRYVVPTGWTVETADE